MISSQLAPQIRAVEPVALIDLGLSNLGEGGRILKSSREHYRYQPELVVDRGIDVIGDKLLPSTCPVHTVAFSILSYRHQISWLVSIPVQVVVLATPIPLRFTDALTDEPRRSGRATKGQHTKERDIAEDASTKTKGKGKAGKAKAAEEEEGEPEEIIRCVCGQYEEEEDNPRTMICCDKCSAWQHNSCMGLPEDYEPPKYFCEQCRPNDHKELIAAMERGEKPWEEAIRQREIMLAEKAKKKGGRKGRKSGAGRTSEVASHASQDVEEPSAPAVAGQKRKLEESPSLPDVKVSIILPQYSVPTDSATEQESARGSCRRCQWRQCNQSRDSVPPGSVVRVCLGSRAGRGGVD